MSRKSTCQNSKTIPSLSDAKNLRPNYNRKCAAHNAKSNTSRTDTTQQSCEARGSEATMWEVRRLRTCYESKSAAWKNLNEKC